MAVRLSSAERVGAMVALEINTLLLAAILARLSYIVMFVVLALRRHPDTYLYHWAGSIACSMIGLSMTFLDQRVTFLPPGMGAVVYGIFATSLALLWSGLRSFDGYRPIWRVQIVCVAGTAATYAGLSLVWPDGRFAMAGMFLCLSAVMVQVLRTLFTTRDRTRLVSRYLVGTALSVFLLLFLATSVIAVAAPERVLGVDNVSYSLVADQALSVLIYIGLLAMAGERAHSQVERLALTDPLTGLVNRRGIGILAERLTRLPASLHRTAAVLVCDIDRFKAINDTHGHEAGDAVLRQFATRLSGTFRRRTDIVGRWGGEEFLIVLPDTPLAEALRLAERFRRSVEETPFDLDGRPLDVTVSIGATAIPAGEDRLDPAVRRADAALYEAKSEGRNRVRLGAPEA